MRVSERNGTRASTRPARDMPSYSGAMLKFNYCSQLP